jgi:ubiquitin carboxyl-terminal hydrolase 9/13
MNFPSKAFLESIGDEIAIAATNGTATGHTNTSTTPYPNPLSPARKVAQPASPGPNVAIKPEESKDSPEYKKKMAIQNGPVLDMTYDNSKKYGMDESLFTSLKDIFEAVINQKSRIGVVSPHKFLEILRRENEMFRSAMHQDAHEFLNLLLNQVVDNVEMFSSQHPKPLKLSQSNGSTPENALSKVMTNGINGTSIPANGLDTTWVHDLFEGTLTSETRCLTCENTSQRDEAFLDLSVDLETHTSVTSCLRKFSEEEMLCERNKFHCDNCGGLQEAEKRMKIKRLPRILALHLKRFKYTEDLQRLQKLFHRVAYPFYLRLFNTTDGAEDSDRLYELYAVVVHIGGGPYHGHYVSIIKTQDRGWLLFDDELVEPVDKNYVMNFFGGEPVPGVQDAKQLACAYVLFYQETTMEAMMKEQETESQQSTKPRTSDAGTAPDSAMSPTQLYHTQTVTDLPHDILDHMKPLAHAATAPVNMRQPSDFIPPMPNIIPVMPPRSKKELKAEEKERKAAQKAGEKAVIAQRRDLANKRMDAWRQEEAELAQVMAKSKKEAEEEDAKRRNNGEEKPTKEEKEKEKEKTGLARFTRHGSISLRGKPLFGGKDKDKDKDKEKEKEKEREKDVTPLPAVADEEPHEAPPVPTSPAMEEKPRKNRFSLGRKKSNAFL